ncbi:MAG: hypothetical protein WC602_01550, partial [archaeon]
AYGIAYKNYRVIGGGSWDANFTVISASNSTGAFTPSIAADSNSNLHVAWYDASTGKYQVYYRRYWDSLGWDANIAKVSSTTDYAALPSIATDSGNNVHLAWMQGPWGVNSSVYFNIYYSKLSAGQNSWGVPLQVSSLNPVEYNPTLLADQDRNLHLVWMGRSAGNYDVYYKKFRSDTNSWDANATNLSNNSQDSSYPSIAVYKDFIHVFWQDSNSGNPNVMRREFNNGWQTTEMTTNSGSDVYPNASISTAERLVEWVWQRGTSPSYEIKYGSRFQNHAPQIKLFFPPNNRWVSGATNRIDFNLLDLDNDSLSAALYYSGQKGARQNLIANLNLSTACSNPDNSNLTDNNCHYDWNTSALADGNYFIDLNAYDAYSSVQSSNDSNFAFSLFAPPFVRLDYPNGGEIVTGRTVPLRFTVQDNNASALYAAIYYSATKGAKQNLIVSGISLSGVCTDSDGTTRTDNNCTYNWDANGVAEGNYYIDLNVNNSLKSTLISSASTFFYTRNTAPDANLVIPAGGEVWAGDLNRVYFNVRDREGDALAANLKFREVGAFLLQTSEADFNLGTFDRTDSNSGGLVRLAKDGIPFFSSGTYTSKAFDANTGVQWKYLEWSSFIPVGTDLNLQYRTSSDGNSWGNWSAVIPQSGSLFDDSNRYFQYKANFFTSIPNTTPALLDVNIEYINPNSIPFSGTAIFSDLNLSNPAFCSPQNNSTLTTNNCHYDWNLAASGLQDLHYYAVDLNVFDSDMNTTKYSGAFLYRREGAPSVRVIKPNGGETTGGSTYSIDFNVSDPNGKSLHAYLYYSHSQAAFETLIDSIDLNSSYCIDSDFTTVTTNACSYVWSIPLAADKNVLWIDVNVFDSKFSGRDSSDGNFLVTFDVENPKIFAVYPTAYNPKYIAPGQTVDVNFYYIEKNPVSYLVAIQKSGVNYCLKQSASALVSSGDANNRIDVNDSCAPSAPSEGYYDLNLTLVDAANNYSTSIQYNAVRVDSTAPSLSVSGITSTKYYENDLLFSCVDNMSGCAQPVKYYFSATASCSQSESAYDRNSYSGMLSIADAHTDYFCALAKDNVGNARITSPALLSIDPTVYVLEQQTIQPRATALADANSYCTVTIDQNLKIDCVYPTTIKFRYYPTHVSATFTDVPRLIVSQPQSVSVVAAKKFDAYSNPGYYFNFLGGDANLVSGANKEFINAVIQRRVIPLLKANGDVEIGTLYVKVQAQPPS